MTAPHRESQPVSELLAQSDASGEMRNGFCIGRCVLSKFNGIGAPRSDGDAGLLALADYLVQQNEYHSNSICAKDPIIVAHIALLATWERQVRQAASVPSADVQRSGVQTASAADEMIGQIEARFPDWKSYRDLVDCIDVTLHRLRGGR